MTGRYWIGPGTWIRDRYAVRSDLGVVAEILEVHESGTLKIRWYPNRTEYISIPMALERFVSREWVVTDGEISFTASDHEILADGGVTKEHAPSYDVEVHRRAQHELDALHDARRRELVTRVTEASQLKSPTRHACVDALRGYDGLLKVRVEGYRAICVLDSPVFRVLLVDKRKRVYDRLDVAIERREHA